MSSTTMEEPPAQEAAELDDNPLKRKSAPELSPESPKRTRTDSDGAAAEHREPPKRSVEEARARVAQEEKRRGVRLFGGLLGTLSQRQANPAQQQKRLEIERRQQERLKAQRDVEERALEEKRAAREEQVLHVRHSTLRAQAGSLRTKARPAIFYKPWILTAEQKDQIKRQRRDADETIEREMEEFRKRKEEHAGKYGIDVEAEKREPARPAEAEKLSEPIAKSEQTPTPAERKHSRPGPDHDHHDDTNDVVVESGEDVVIY